MKIKFKLAAMLSTALLAFSLLSGCVEKPQEDVQNSDWEGKEEFTASDRYTDAVKALEARYNDYLEKTELGFAQTDPTDESFFETDRVDGGVKITAYVGDDEIVIIPETIGGLEVKEIGEGAFASKNMKAVSVPDTVKFTGKGAFENCNSLTSIRLPFIGDGQDITHFGYIFGADSYENHPLRVPTSLDIVIIGGSGRAIAENAFAGCKSLSAVAVPDTVEEIERFAFYECLDLVYFDSSSSVKSVGEYAFGHCTTLFTANFDKAQSIGMGAFYGCSSMRNLSLPFVGENPEENRFLGYIFGAEVADYNDEFVPASLYSVKLSGCDEIPDRAFASCKYIGEFILEEGIETIGARAFYACRSIIEISLPDTVKVIGDDAFFGCDNLVDIDFGSGVEKIGMQAFFGCRALERVEIPYKVTEIKASTFALCINLKRVTLNNVSKVGKEAFRSCNALEAVDCEGIEVAEGNSALVLIAPEE